ncbi:hypothetical protein B0H16DRAFT_1731616 [Mycena metata]|uniref:Ribonuclease H1 N-terminal domain-containing protein n=1 Tax=Mycena metata TaxID=1033252 RepID=A0AAD7I610_9AGAR|nr:hypothetical protein B0H16DRAFT_1731616 [Mycena metata]
MPCTPPYHAGPGHTDQVSHDKSSACLYYAVAAGRVHGVFSNSWIARLSTDGFVDFSMKSFKTWQELEFWWGVKCSELHRNGCPPFEPVSFSLTLHPAHQPGPPPCTHHFPAPPSTIPHYFPPAVPVAGPSSFPAPRIVPTAGPSSVPAPRIVPTAPSPFPAPGVSVVPTAAPSPFNARCASISTSMSTLPAIAISSSASSSSSSLLSASSLSASSCSSRFKKEEPTSPIMGSPSVAPHAHDSSVRLHLTPSGKARGEFLIARNTQLATPTRTRGAPDDFVLDDDDDDAAAEAAVVAAAPASPAPSAPLPSVLVTPVPGAAAAGPSSPAPASRLYGVRGVGVFYNSFDSARRAARRLDLPDSKIMVSTDAAKIEAWITGQPFDGEDA